MGMLGYTGKYVMNNPVLRRGYVKVNEVVVLESALTPEYLNYRGINILTIDPFNCSLLDDPKTFDTHVDFDFHLKYYLEDGIIDSSVMIAVTFDEPMQYFRNVSRDTFTKYYHVPYGELGDDYQGTFSVISMKSRTDYFSTKSNGTQSLIDPAWHGVGITGIYLFIYLS